MAIQAAPLLGQPMPKVMLRDDAIAVPALSSHIRPALVLAERESRSLLDTAAAQDVGRGGQFAAGPAGIQVWDGPFNGAGGHKGTAKHLGSVDWSYDTPARHYVTIYRAMVTAHGLAVGEDTLSILTRVLSLGGLSMDGTRLCLPEPPKRDPFRGALPGELGRALSA